MNTAKQSLPTAKEWTESGFNVPAELYSDQPKPVAGHTPGEWRFSHDNDGLHAFRIASNGLILADVFFKTGYHHAPEIEQAEANARLIASSPRLARENEALREALKALIERTPTVAQCETSLQCLRARPRMDDPQWREDLGSAMTCLSFSASLDHCRAALALAGKGSSTPKPPSDAATGTPEGKEGANP